MKTQLAWLLATWFGLTNVSAATCIDQRIESDGVTGFQEAVISVTDLAAATETWRNVAGFEVLCEQVGTPELARFWGLPEDTRIDQVILKKAVSDRGLIRLVRFHGLAQVQIRSSGTGWDTGGIFDLYFYTEDVNDVFNGLRQRGWQAYNDPVGYVLGPFDILEVIMRGPNGEVLVVMQRNAPPYDKSLWGVDNGLGWPFNSALIVKDYDAHMKLFGEQLGWSKHLGGKNVSEAPGENPSGFPWSLAQTAPRVFQAFANHETNRNGSIQLMHIEGVSGKDFSARAKPPNLGILTLRIPVADLKEFAGEFEGRGGKILTPAQTFTLAPFGKVDILAIETPEGARLEFFQQR
jgi:predicted enzyme related to lactoylglutathione lyase